MNYDYGDGGYDYGFSNNSWDDAAQVNMAEIEDIENNLNFTDADEMFTFAIHGIDISNVNSDYLRAFQYEINAIATDFCNNRAPFDKTRACLIYG